MKKYRIIVAGGRDFNDFDRMTEVLDGFLKYSGSIEVVCGMARGADLLGKRWAELRNVPVVEFPADWNKYGKRAGYLRNVEMSKYGTTLVAFWDGKSRGTKHTIDIANDANLYVGVVRY